VRLHNALVSGLTPTVGLACRSTDMVKKAEAGMGLRILAAKIGVACDVTQAGRGFPYYEFTKIKQASLSTVVPIRYSCWKWWVEIAPS